MPQPDAFHRCLAVTLRFEGGWSDDPRDPGGALIPDGQVGAFVDYVSGWARCDAIWRAWAGSLRR